jgi:hypothetical protein
MHFLASRDMDQDNLSSVTAKGFMQCFLDY